MKRIVQRILSWAVDIIALLVILAVLMDVFHNILKGSGTSWSNLFGLMLILLVFMPFWVQVRIYPRLAKLAGNIAFRSELAVTPIDGGVYLMRQLCFPLVRSFLPFACWIPGAIYALYREEYFFVEGFFISLILLMVFCAMLLLGIWVVSIAATQVMDVQFTRAHRIVRLVGILSLFVLSFAVLIAVSILSIFLALTVGTLVVLLTAPRLIWRNFDEAGSRFLTVEAA